MPGTTLPRPLLPRRGWYDLCARGGLAGIRLVVARDAFGWSAPVLAVVVKLAMLGALLYLRFAPCCAESWWPGWRRLPALEDRPAVSPASQNCQTLQLRSQSRHNVRRARSCAGD